MTTDPTPEPVEFHTVPPPIAPVARGWQAWWENHDMWDGFLLYADLDTAKRHAAVDYIGEEYGWVPGDDPADEAPDVKLTWVFERTRWYLLDNGKGTDVQLYESATYGPAASETERRDRYAQAISETDGWVLDGGQHMIDAVMAVADAEQAELRRERDLAIAHDATASPQPAAVEEQPDTNTPKTAAALLSSSCDACRHTLNWHRNDVGCTVVLCVCSRFRQPDGEA